VPAAPPKKSRKGLFIGCGIALVVVLLACGVLGFLGYSAAQAALQPIKASQTFCNDLKAQDYTSAYGMLSTTYQGQVTQDQFTQASQLHDQIDGSVKTCAPASGNTSSFNFSLDSSKTTASFDVTVTRNKEFTGKLSLVKQGSDWKIDAIDPALQGTDLGPLQVANTFCQALVKGDYQTAYNQFSSDRQAAFTEAQYAAQLAQALGTGASITGCTPNLSTYSVSGTTATLDSTLNVSVQGQTVPVPQTVTFTKENGVWKISNLQNKVS
jgi:limonene-1,2-epoxide hydrolase